MRWTAILNSELKCWRDGCDLEGEQRRRWRTLGALKDDLRRIKASCALNKLSLSTDLARSSHPSDQSRTDPVNRGALFGKFSLKN